MGGMYNLVMGDGHEGERGVMVMRILGIEYSGRFRDAWIEKGDDGPVIAIYTRNGGGNREDYEDVITAMQSNPHYLRDADDEFDPTYATFYFRVPDEWRDALEPMATEPIDMSARWKAAIAAIGGGS